MHWGSALIHSVVFISVLVGALKYLPFQFLGKKIEVNPRGGKWLYELTSLCFILVLYVDESGDRLLYIQSQLLSMFENSKMNQICIYIKKLISEKSPYQLL